LASGLAIVYFLAAKLGLSLQAQPSDVAVFWPASGLAAGVLIVAGRRAFPALLIGVVVGTVAANILNDRSLSTSVLKGLCNAGEAALVALLIEKWFGPRFAFDDIRQLVGFLAAGALAAAASGVGGAATIILFHTSAPFSGVWRDWFLSDGIGIVAVAPFVVGLVETYHHPPLRREWTEGLAALVLLVAVSSYVVSQPTTSWLSFSPGAAVLPLLLWLAARCPPTFAIAGAFFASAAVICATNFGLGRFGDPAIPVLERVRGAQTAVMTVTVYTLALVALFAAKSRGERALKQGLQRLRLALDGAHLGTFSANLVTGQLECDVRAGSMHGYTAPPRTLKEARRFVPAEDLARIDAAAARTQASTDVWNAEYRVVPPQNHPHVGETRWIAVESSVVRDFMGSPTGLIGVTRDVTERKRAEEQRAFLNAELDHRVKNALATVCAIIALTRKDKRSVADFVTAIESRVASLAGTHELLSHNHWHGVSLEELVRSQLAPYASGNIETIGPRIIFRPHAAQSVAMVFHELSTNAAKYGALSSPYGRLSVRWQWLPNGAAQSRVTIEWEETGGPIVSDPELPGFGTGIIRELIPHEISGTVDLTFPSVGVRCRLELPADSVA
jgi:PAS domain S-box-containing protein